MVEIPDYYVAGVVWTAFCFCVGVTWSAYRAVGWVERIRTWAGQVCDEASAALGGAVPVTERPGWDYFDIALLTHDGRGTE